MQGVDQCSIAAELFGYPHAKQDVVTADRFAVVPVPLVASGFTLVDCSSSSQSSSYNTATTKQYAQRLRRAHDRIVQLKARLHSVECNQKQKQSRPYVGALVSLMGNRHHGSAASAAAWSDLLCPSHHISRQTVCRWELAAGSSVIASMTAFHQHQEAHLQSLSCDVAQWSGSITELIGDATKSGCWKEHKVQCLFMRQTYVHGSAVDSRECWPDIQVVTDASANGCYKIVKKQLRLVQCPILDTANTIALGPKQIRFICINGDQGPDQQGFRKIVGQQYIACPRVIVVALPCIAHQQSLACGRVLARIEMCFTAFDIGVSYYTSLVKLAHVWRSDTTLVHIVARSRFGSGSQVADADHAKKKSPQCCATRWGSVHNVEKYFLAFSSEHVCKRILSDAYFNNMPEEDAEPAHAIADAEHRGKNMRAPIDDIALDAMDAHKQKQTRWKRDVRKATESSEFWLMMRISHKSLGPLAHFLHILQPKVPDPESTPLIALVCGGKSDEIMHEFESVLADPVWEQQEVPFLHRITPAHLYGTVVTLVCLGAAEYHSRVHSITSHLPLQLFWLPHSGPRTYCAERQRVCKHVLTCDIDQLDVTTAKLKHAMLASFQEGAQHGMMSVEDHALLVEWRKRVRESAQIVESANSVITHMTKTANRMDHPLLASRFTQKQAILSRGNDTPAVLALANEVSSTFSTQQYKSIVLTTTGGLTSRAHIVQCHWPLCVILKMDVLMLNKYHRLKLEMLQQLMFLGGGVACSDRICYLLVSPWMLWRHRQLHR